jgi:predicted HTH transcriptional regulator
LEFTDLDSLVQSEARETDELEFKGTLPFAPTKGQDAIADRWIEKGDRLGDFSRDKLLAEIVAFANGDGGTLVLGLHETKGEIRRAERLEALPNCEGLARRLVDASEDLIEPRLQSLAAKAVVFPGTEDGAGFVVMRVGKSAIGPHRLSSTREFLRSRGRKGR